MTPDGRAWLVAGWRRDLDIGAALLHALSEAMGTHGGDPAHLRSLGLIIARLDEIAGDMQRRIE